MSGFCLFNLKKHNLNFENLNDLANALVSIALKNQLGIFFNCNDYGKEIIQATGMRDYFHLSNSFLYKNCDFLDIPNLIMHICNVNSVEELDISLLPNKVEIQQEFLREYCFFEEILECIFKFDVFEIEIYITDEYGPVLFFEEFNPIIVDEKNFLNQLFDSLNDSLGNGFNYEFSATRFIIQNK